MTNFSSWQQEIAVGVVHYLVDVEQSIASNCKDIPYLTTLLAMFTIFSTVIIVLGFSMIFFKFKNMDLELKLLQQYSMFSCNNKGQPETRNHCCHCGLAETKKRIGHRTLISGRNRFFKQKRKLTTGKKKLNAKKLFSMDVKKDCDYRISPVNESTSLEENPSNISEAVVIVQNREWAIEEEDDNKNVSFNNLLPQYIDLCFRNDLETGAYSPSVCDTESSIDVNICRTQMINYIPAAMSSLSDISLVPDHSEAGGKLKENIKSSLSSLIPFTVANYESDPSSESEVLNKPATAEELVIQQDSTNGSETHVMDENEICNHKDRVKQWVVDQQFIHNAGQQKINVQSMDVTAKDLVSKQDSPNGNETHVMDENGICNHEERRRKFAGGHNKEMNDGCPSYPQVDIYNSYQQDDRVGRNRLPIQCADPHNKSASAIDIQAFTDRDQQQNPDVNSRSDNCPSPRFSIDHLYVTAMEPTGKVSDRCSPEEPGDSSSIHTPNSSTDSSALRGQLSAVNSVGNAAQSAHGIR